MGTKSLKDKAISFKGKQYVLVADRVVFFNETYPEGSITTELVSEPTAEVVIVKATIKPNEKQTFTAYSQAKWGQGYINQTSALENAETSAVGRALAFMGIGVIESIASIDEINKANSMVEKARKGEPLDVVDYAETTEKYPEVGHNINEAKKAHNRDVAAAKRAVKNYKPELGEADPNEIPF